jgi:hypothetical protein
MDINSLTLGELAKIEELGGASMSTLQDETKPKAKMLAALAFVIKRRENPKITMIEIENTPIKELEDLFSSLNGLDTIEKK